MEKDAGEAAYQRLSVSSSFVGRLRRFRMLSGRNALWIDRASNDGRYQGGHDFSAELRLLHDGSRSLDLRIGRMVAATAVQVNLKI